MSAKQPGSTGEFFAIDRRAWAMACKQGLNPAVVYLLLARGTGPDQRTTSWSVNAVENYTGISRPRARDGLEKLVQAGLVRITQGGTRPRYYLIPAHEVPGAEGCLGQLDDAENVDFHRDLTRDFH